MHSQTQTPEAASLRLSLPRATQSQPPSSPSTGVASDSRCRRNHSRPQRHRPISSLIPFRAREGLYPRRRREPPPLSTTGVVVTGTRNLRRPTTEATTTPPEVNTNSSRRSHSNHHANLPPPPPPPPFFFTISLILD
ncbi:hypothetical protein V8G54_035801 [Vigna mungo]|uniref:Uncharacterized protein n=1 Tax=Vigna mungo TaxID=3915 RepID=A0AAQ3MFZ2_VIGMU